MKKKKKDCNFCTNKAKKQKNKQKKTNSYFEVILTDLLYSNPPEIDRSLITDTFQ